MSDLIDRQAAIKWIKTESNPYGNPTLDFESGKKAIEHLEQMPSAEPNYCRECKWSKCCISTYSNGETETYWHCLNWDGGTDEEGYCHEWEGRTNETD